MSTPNLPKPSPKFLPSRQTLRKHKTSIRRALSRDKLLLWMVVVPMLFSMVYFVILAKDVSADTATDSIDDWQVVETPAMKTLRADKKS